MDARWILATARIAGEQVGNPTDSGNEVEDERVDELAHDENDKVGETDTWIDWLRRRTRIAEHTLKALRLDDWVQAQRGRKWQAAWASAMLSCVPPDGCRARGRPKKRWTDVTGELFLKDVGMEERSWMAVAANREEDFAHFLEA